MKRFIRPAFRRFCVDNKVKEMEEYKAGVQSLSGRDYNKAEYHFTETLKILKHSNQTLTLSYLHVLKKLTKTLFEGRKLDECLKILDATVEMTSNFKNNELSFTANRNKLVFLTRTDLNAAIEYSNELLSQQDEGFSKYFQFHKGALLLLNNDLSQARKVLDSSLEEAYPTAYLGHLHNNYAVLLDKLNAMERRQDPKYKQLSEEINIPHSTEAIAEKYLKGIFLYEVDRTKPDFEQKMAENPLLPDISTEEMVEFIGTLDSALSVTSLAEKLFEEGKEKETAYWLKVGIKAYEKLGIDRANKHLSIFALFYSQMGQNTLAEGLYRKVIEQTGGMSTEYSGVLARHMFGTLLLRDPKRKNEGEVLIQEARKMDAVLPFWYGDLEKVRCLDFDFI